MGYDTSTTNCQTNWQLEPQFLEIKNEIKS